MPDGSRAYTGTMAVLLEANSLTKRYGTTIALDDVDFQVADGITGLLGPNGAGKSTAIKLSLGLIRPTAGSAEVMGRRPYDSPEVRERLGYMPEHDCLPPGITAAEFLSHMAQVSGLPPAQDHRDAGDRAGGEHRGITGDLPSAVPVLWYGLLTAGPALLLWRRYNNMST